MDKLLPRGLTASRLEFCLVFLSLILWWIFPQLTWQPLIFGAAAVASRAAWRRPVLPATIHNLPAGLWMAMAVVGAWAAYDRQVGIKLLALTAGGLLLFYALAGLDQEDFWPVVGVFGGFCSFLVVYFLLTQDWQWMPADVQVINRIGIRWMQLRPAITWQKLHPNMVAGVLAPLFPVVLALGIQYHRQTRSWQFIAALVSSVMMSFGLLMTSSRAAWVILAGGLAFWWLLKRCHRLLFPTRRWAWTFASIIFIIGASIAVAANYILSQSVVNLFGMSGSLGSRLELYSNTLQLAQDALWTGYGLGSFPGVYSSYLLLIQVPLYFYGHNLYLDVLVEQGIFGLLGWLGLMFAGAVVLLIGIGWANEEKRVERPLTIPVLIGLLIVMLHGLIDNPFAESWSRPLLNLLPGLAAAVAMSRNEERITVSSKVFRLAAMIVLLVFATAAFWRPVRANVLADLAVVAMSKLQLAEWPENANSLEDDASLAPVEADLARVLELDRSNAAAHYRLGLIALQSQDFEIAKEHLQIAAQDRKSHRGIRKALGLALTWLGEEQMAVEVFAGIPETAGEMDVYAWWWQQQNRPELSLRAQRMADLLSARVLPTQDNMESDTQ